MAKGAAGMAVCVKNGVAGMVWRRGFRCGLPFITPLRGETMRLSDGAMRVAVPGGLASWITSTFGYDHVRRFSLASSTA